MWWGGRQSYRLSSSSTRSDDASQRSSEVTNDMSPACAHTPQNKTPGMSHTAGRWRVSRPATAVLLAAAKRTDCRSRRGYATTPTRTDPSTYPTTLPCRMQQRVNVGWRNTTHHGSVRSAMNDSVADLHGGVWHGHGPGTSAVDSSDDSQDRIVAYPALVVGWGGTLFRSGYTRHRSAHRGVNAPRR